jgi:hypothetical protein
MIPKTIQDLILDATDGRADGWTAEAAREELREIRNLINNALEEKCVRCHTILVVPHQRYFADMPEGKVCMICLGGS